MAIIPCRECAHQVSDQATSCPSCGAPVAPTVKTELRWKRISFGVLITLMTLWTLGTLLWLLAPSRAPDRPITRSESAADQPPGPSKASGSSDTTLTSDQSSSAQRATADRSAAVLPAPNRPAPDLRPVYRTTAEQLYRDFDANVVAIQSNIGASRVRLTGTVAEIDQDGTGHPVVRLWTGKDSTAAMTLAEDQRSAAAHLAKGEAVEIECDKVGHTDALLQGSDCTLAFVDARPREVNLALLLANENGTTRVYVVGPMPESVCLAHSDDISSRLQQDQRGEHLVWRNCTDAARESIPPAGCRLNSSPVTISEVPTANLWRYDCGSSIVAHTSAGKKAQTSSRENAATLASTSAPATLAAVDSKAVEGTPPAPAIAPASTAAPVNAGIAAPAARVADYTATNKIHLASAGDSDIGPPTAGARVPAEEVTVAHAPQAPTENKMKPEAASRDTTSPWTTATPDDLAQVRAVDPQAANHISTYCSETIASADRNAFMAECRRREAEAWRRLVLQNEFPTLDEATRKKCSEPPYPDTYVARESCAKYELHAN